VTRGFRIGYVLALGLCTALLSLAPSTATAQTARVVVQTFRGPSGNVARAHVLGALKNQSEVELVRAEPFQGLSGEALRDAAAEAEVNAVLEGKVRKKGKQLQVIVSVRDASSGEVLHEQDWTRRKNQLGEIRDNFWTLMGPYILKAQAPEKRVKKEAALAASAAAATAPTRRVEEPERPPPAPARSSEAAAPIEEEPEPSAASGGRNAAHPALVAALGPRLMWRDLSFDGDTDLNGYSSYAEDNGSPAFNLALSVQWFPGAHKRSDWVSNFGIEADGDIALGLKSKQGSEEYKTRAYTVNGNLMYRLPFEIFEPQVRVGYALQEFKIDGPESLGVPPVKYQSVRFGAGVLLKLHAMFALDAAFGYLLVLDTGKIGTKQYAQKLEANGWEVGGGATVKIKHVYGIRLGAEFRRYKLDTGKSENDDWILPKGGTDDYLTATLSFVYSLPGAK
jgi:hypothetical protein